MPGEDRPTQVRNGQRCEGKDAQGHGADNPTVEEGTTEADDIRFRSVPDWGADLLNAVKDDIVRSDVPATI